MEIDYDSEADILYVSWQDADETTSIDRDDDIIVRKDAETGQTIGYTVLNFSSQTEDTPVTVPAQETLEA